MGVVGHIGKKLKIMRVRVGIGGDIG